MNTGMRYTFGRSKAEPIFTEIGGIGNIINTKSQLANLLQIAESEISFFEVQNGNIKTIINIDYSIPKNAFNNAINPTLSQELRFYHDFQEKLQSLREDCFAFSNLESFISESADILGEGLYNARKLKNIELGVGKCSFSVRGFSNVGLDNPLSDRIDIQAEWFKDNSNNPTNTFNGANIDFIGTFNFVGTQSLFSGFSGCKTTNILFPNAVFYPTYNSFWNLSECNVIDLRNVTEMLLESGVSESDYVFRNIKLNCELRLNSVLQDIDGNGTIHPSVLYAINQRNANVIWY